MCTVVAARADLLGQPPCPRLLTKVRRVPTDDRGTMQPESLREAPESLAKSIPVSTPKIQLPVDDGKPRTWYT
jgi:hypothetical protein